jgi:hypothetical protein
VVHAGQVQCSVQHGLAQVLGALRADRDVADLARPLGRAGAVDREREDVGGLVAAAVLAVQLADPLLGDELDGDVPVVDPARGERQRAQLGDVLPGQRVADDLDFEQLAQARLRSAGRSSGAWRSECAS